MYEVFAFLFHIFAFTIDSCETDSKLFQIYSILMAFMEFEIIIIATYLLNYLFH